MKQIVVYDAKDQNGRILLSKCTNNIVEEKVCTEWIEVIEWLVDSPENQSAFTVCFNLTEFTRVIFSLLPQETRDQIEKDEDKVIYQDVKIFYANGRYLGLTAKIPVDVNTNRYRKAELNLQALRWWVSEEEAEPADVAETWKLGSRIVEALDKMKLYPLKLTSPISVFADSYLGDARKYPTVFNFPDEYFGAMEYATEMMRYEWRSAYKLGYFEETYQYDIISSYPAIIARLPDTTKCQCEFSTTRPEWSTWGIMYGEVNITADVSPIVGDLGDDRINYKGRKEDRFTTREIDWITKHDAGTFKLRDGYFFKFGELRPYRGAISYLFNYKKMNEEMVSTIAKRAMNGLSGKLDEDRQDGKKGDYYNPILACMVRSEARLNVADFIYNNGLVEDVIAVLVDSVLSQRYVELEVDERIGRWRYEGCSPAIVLSKGNVWRPDKRPQGIKYVDLLQAMKNNPESAYYEFTTESGSVRSIDLMLMDQDREYAVNPECGGDILNNKYESTAIELD